MLAVGVCSSGGWASTPGAGPAEKPAATASAESRAVAVRVNGRPIHDDDATRLAEAYFGKFRRFASDKPTPDLWADLRSRAVQELIAVELLVQAGEALDLPGIDEKVEKSLEKAHAPAASEAEVRSTLRRSILIAEYLKHAGVADPEIPESEIRNYYDRNKENFRRKESVHVRHILVQVKKDAETEEKEAGRRKIEKARDEILGGKDFAEAAKEYSGDNAASAGGDIGYRERGFMPLEFDAVAFSIEKNRLSNVIETEFGFHLLEVLDRIPAGIPPYPELRGFFEKYLKMEASKKKKASLVDQLRAKAIIEVLGKE